MRILSEFIQGDTKIITVQIEKDEELTTKKKKRSKNANAYFWELLNQVCQKMNLDVIKEYQRRVKELGIFRQWEIDNVNVPTFEKMWESKGIAWFTEKVDENGEKTTINAYYGSSSYNSKQMSRLIDNLVQDCKEIGIETLDEMEINSLINEM
jgi:hypothetical protein